MKRCNSVLSKRAFTLIEIMIVMLVIGILLAIAVPAFVKARDNSTTKACISNLREFEEAKEQWAMETSQSPTATPTQANLYPAYLHNWPTCPLSGSYSLGNLSTRPTCSVAAHVLP